MYKKLFLLTALLCLTTTTPAYAGDINGNEQSIVSVIHGQFEQEGVVYRVRQEYINSAMDYLQQDDVDLTSDDAQMVISEIYSSVQTGVESGYLEEVGRKAPATESPSPSNEPSSSETVSSESTLTESEAISEAIPEPEDGAESKPAVETEPETEPESEPIPMAISALEVVNAAPELNYEYISKDTQALMQQVHIPYKMTLGVLLFLLIAMVGIAGICLWEKRMAKRRHGRLRGILKAVLVTEIAAIFVILELIAGLWLGAFQDSAILNRVNETDYYRTVHEELRHDTRISFALMGIPEEVMDQAITYERVVLASRQQIENNLNQGNYKADTTILTDQLKLDIQDYLEQQSVTMTDKAEVGLNLLIQRIDAKYEKLLEWPFGSWWAQFSTEFRTFASKALPLLLLLAVSTHALLLWLHHYRHRAVKRCGTGICIGSVTVILMGVIPYLTGVMGPKEMIPEYMGQFFRIYMTGITWAVMAAGGIGILLGITYWFVAKAWKEGT